MNAQRCWRASIVLAAALAGHPTCEPDAAVAQPPRRGPRLFKDSRQALAAARAQGQSHISLVVAAVSGRTRSAAADARRLGGEIRYQDDEVGYLRVRLPLDAVTELTESAAVVAAAADWHIGQAPRLPSRTDTESTAHASAVQANGGSPQRARPARLPDSPLRNSYSPLPAIGAAALRAAHPTYDGRGVTIAVFDGNPDMLLPELQTAYSLDGRRIPKIAGVLNVTDPRDDAAHVPRWVDMAEEVHADASRIGWRGQTYTTPYSGRFRVGLFDERRFTRYSGNTARTLDIDFSGDRSDDDGRFAVLWDETSGDVWVDTNRNLTFLDERRLGDYRSRQVTGVFGKDDPSTAERETIGFTVQIEPQTRFISINPGIDEHATMILGAAVANREPSGRLAGIAPGARIVSVFYGSTMHGALEGLIRIFRDPAIDLIAFEQHTGMMTHSYLPSDGRHPFTVIVQRLAERYQKLMFVPGSNRPGVGLVAEDGNAPGIISVGAYQSRGSYSVNWGLELPGEDHLHYAGLSHGPSGSGALKPDLLAPTGLISTRVGFLPGEVRKGLYELPPGYTVAGGTSTAAPVAAGAAAVLLSATRQKGVPADGPRLKAALANSARFIPHLGAHEQGVGLIQIEPALALLGRAETAPLRITTRAPVRTALSAWLSSPHEGVGLYEREGWTAGQSGRRAVTFTRTTGPASPMAFTVKWIGNDGTFSSDASIVLPLGRSVALPVDVQVKTAGVHSAILVLEHPSIPGAAARVLCAIVAALPLHEGNGFSVSTKVSVPRASDRGVFVNVPPGAGALALSVASRSGPVRITLVSPYRQNLLPCVGPSAINLSAPPAPRCAIARPAPGVWEINLWDGDLTYGHAGAGVAQPRDITLTASVLGVDVDVSSDGGRDVAFRNRGAALEAAATTPSPLGSAYRTSRSIRPGAQHLYVVNVPEGARLLRAAVRSNDARDDLDIYLLACRTDESSPAERERQDRIGPGGDPASLCVPVAKDAANDARGEVDVAGPAPGKWVVVVDAYAVAGKAASYHYFDAFTDPGFGQLAAPDTPQRREAGGIWTTRSTARVMRSPDAPRELYGRLTVNAKDVVQALTDRHGQRSWAVPVGSLDLFLPGEMRSSGPSR